MYRAAVVGCGMIGAGPARSGLGVQSHAAAWAHRPDVELVAVADPDRSRMEAARTVWGARAGYASVEELLGSVKPDLVSICSPDETHAAVLRAVLAAPSVKAILAEKPLTLDSREAASLVGEADRRGILLAVNYGRRFTPSHQELRQWLADHPIGEIECVRGVYVRGIKHNGTHWLDLARFLVDEIMAIVGDGPVDSWAADSTIDAAMTFANGAKGQLHGVKHARYALFEMDLIGTEGRVRIQDGGRRFVIERSAPSREFPGFRDLTGSSGPRGGIEDMLLYAVSDLIEALEHGRAPACTGADAVIALELAERALRTATHHNSRTVLPHEAHSH